MGILDGLTSMLGGGQGEGEQGEGAMGILGSLLQQGAGSGQSSGIVGALLGAAGGAVGGQPGAEGAPAQGGMQGMLETLAANGLADHVGSWLSNNPNIPVSADQIRGALGSEQVESMANSVGLPVGDFLKHLADHLPQAASEAAGTANG
jgi:uncharacterized protein YidB (DUF937 family)